MAVEYVGGVVIAADSRTTSGCYVTNRMADKLSRVSDKIYCCRSGSASQTQTLAQLVSDKVYALNMYMDYIPVQMVASMFRRNVYMNRQRTQTGIILAGWDSALGGQVYTISPTGLMVQQRVAAAGSGASTIRGYLLGKHRQNMPLQEAVQLLKHCTEMAISFDQFSGGVVRIGVIDENGMSIRRTIPISKEMFQVCNNMLWNLEFN